MGAFPEGQSEIEVIDKRVIKRITFRNFISDVFDAFNISRGGVYSFKMLLINPGKLARDYLGEKRILITAPFKILIISTTVILLLFSTIDIFHSMMDKSFTVTNDTGSELKEKVIQIFSNYFNLILWTYIPISAALSFLFNRKRNFNYAENLVFQTVVLSVTNITAIVLFPVNYYSLALLWVVYQCAGAFYMVYSYKVFFEKKWLRSTLENMVIFIVGSTVWAILLITVLVGISFIVANN